ncbi:tetratricopeptide repeat protein [Roseiconus nitratireducens]|uniref:Tetratricopeptide repeat protein n=1 Tax=Roseiconus nitratireducens TaxID=2605748 RepID=A0A5M6D1L1_9BACT|nr:tetratricopeptide repeat protein [Roseiconus nitratireducens]KAA5540192.1 tetratricopeptide repeat protein [Roseiconus nitratireducens]
MKSIPRLMCVLLAIAWLGAQDIAAQSADSDATTDASPPAPIELLKSATAELRRGHRTEALQLARQLADQPVPRNLRSATADLLLRAGDPDRAVKLFDQFLDDSPNDKPYLWQRGISLYFAGKYAEGAEQFEVHRKVNPNDVENAAWHYLCVAKKESPEKAQQLLLPAPGDLREPMDEVLEMLRTGDPDGVSRRMDAIAASDAAHRSARFYGHLYLGLFADAQGRKAEARKQMESAVRFADRGYMGDVARVYADHLQ